MVHQDWIRHEFESLHRPAMPRSQTKSVFSPVKNDLYSRKRTSTRSRISQDTVLQEVHLFSEEDFQEVVGALPDLGIFIPSPSSENNAPLPSAQDYTNKFYPPTSSFSQPCDLDPSLPFPFYCPPESEPSLLYDTDTFIEQPIPLHISPSFLSEHMSPSESIHLPRVKSPSLGYIPTAFPLSLFLDPSGTAQAESQTPPYEPEPSSPAAENTFFASVALSPTLLYEPGDAGKLPTTSASGFGDFSSNMNMSFVSVQSHSTAVHAGESNQKNVPSLRPVPRPVFFTTSMDKLRELVMVVRQEHELARNRHRKEEEEEEEEEEEKKRGDEGKRSSWWPCCQLIP